MRIVCCLNCFPSTIWWAQVPGQKCWPQNHRNMACVDCWNPYFQGLRGIRFRKHPNANQINLSLSKNLVFERHVQGPRTPTDSWWHYRFLWGSTVIQNFKLCFSCPMLMFLKLNGIGKKIDVFASNSVWGYVNFPVHGPWFFHQNNWLYNPWTKHQQTIIHQLYPCFWYIQTSQYCWCFKQLKYGVSKNEGTRKMDGYCNGKVC